MALQPALCSYLISVFDRIWPSLMMCQGREMVRLLKTKQAVLSKACVLRLSCAKDRLRRRSRRATESMREDAGLSKACKGQLQPFHSSASSLSIPQRRRGAHTSTAPTAVPLKRLTQTSVLNLNHKWARLTFRSGPRAVAHSNTHVALQVLFRQTDSGCQPACIAFGHL